MDDQNKRAAPVKLDERPSTADRVKIAQQMQRMMEQPPAAKTSAPAQVARPQTTTKVAAVFDVGAIRNGGTEIAPQIASNPAVYAKAQVDPSKLFGGGDTHELVG